MADKNKLKQVRLERRKHSARNNGLFGTTVGVAFALTSVGSGVALAFGGMTFVLVAALAATVVALALLLATLFGVERRGRRRPAG